MHVIPLPDKPSLHLHVKLLSVLLHCELVLQVWLPIAHSSTSKISNEDARDVNTNT